MATVNIPGVEIVKAGTWNSARGKITITPADLAAMAAESRDPGIDAPGPAPRSGPAVIARRACGLVTAQPGDRARAGAG